MAVISKIQKTVDSPKASSSSIHILFVRTDKKLEKCGGFDDHGSPSGHQVHLIPTPFVTAQFFVLAPSYVFACKTRKIIKTFQIPLSCSNLTAFVDLAAPATIVDPVEPIVFVDLAGFGDVIFPLLL